MHPALKKLRDEQNHAAAQDEIKIALELRKKYECTWSEALKRARHITTGTTYQPNED